MSSDWREGLFESFEALIDLEICRKSVQVPENNKLLRCFQFIKMDTVSVGDYCWNGDCTNCQVWYHTKEQANEPDKPALSCRIDVIEDMVITAMSPFIKLAGITK